MEIGSMPFWSSLFSIVIIDLVLAGDNAIVIGMAARNLPKEQQKKVIFWGTLGAVAVRVLLTLAVVWLLKIPGLLLVGGLFLLRIAYRLLVQEKERETKAARNLYAAIYTIIMADAVMGLDNVIAVAGAAQGSDLMVIMGLAVSIPIVVWGSTLIVREMNRFPFIIYLGAGVLAWTAVNMIADEPLLRDFFAANPVFKWTFSALMAGGVLLLGWQKKRTRGIV